MTQLLNTIDQLNHQSVIARYCCVTQKITSIHMWCDWHHKHLDCQYLIRQLETGTNQECHQTHQMAQFTTGKIQHLVLLFKVFNNIVPEITTANLMKNTNSKILGARSEIYCPKLYKISFHPKMVCGQNQLPVCSIRFTFRLCSIYLTLTQN